MGISARRDAGAWTFLTKTRCSTLLPPSRPIASAFARIDVGFADFRREMTPSFGEAPEAGWVLAAWAHGKGYATEAVRATHAWSDAHLDHAKHTACMIAPANAASVRVAIKCGYSPNGRGTYKGAEDLLFRRSR